MSTELVVSICGLLIALGASIATIWQSFLMRKHNRLSMKPLLRIDTFSLENQHPTISLINDGVGPAIIESIKMYYEGNEIVDESMSKKMYALTEKLHFDVETTKIYAFHKNEVFGTGSHWLFEFNPIPVSLIETTDIFERFKKVKFLISYKSIYKESFFQSFEL